MRRIWRRGNSADRGVSVAGVVAEQLFEHAVQHPRLYGFAEVTVHTEAQKFLFLLLECVRRNGHYGNMLQLRIFPEILEGITAAHNRHVEVHQYHVGFEAAGHFNAFGAVVGERYAGNAEARQEMFHDGVIDIVIVHYQYPGIRGKGGQLGGRGQAQAGYVLGIIGTVLLIFGLLFGLVMGIGGVMAAGGS